VPTELVAEGSFSGRLNRVQIRISTAGALTAKLAWNAKYIGVAQQPAIIRRVFEASVSLIGRRRSAPRKSADPASRWAEL
jgi:hypothetical protein